MEIILGKQIVIPQCPHNIRNKVIKHLTLDNPKYYENLNLGRWNKDTPKKLTFYEERGCELIIPRGFMRHLINICKEENTPFEIVDKRRTLKKTTYSFIGELKDYQKDAVKAMLTKDFGTLDAPTGSGKTVMALYLIAKREQPALIVVPTKELAFQWIQRIETFLGIKEESVGLVGCGKDILGKKITVAMVQSLYKRVDKVSPSIGYVIVDECHRAPSRTFSEALCGFDSKYMTGLSATPYRRDKLSKLIFFTLGNIIHSIDPKYLREKGNILSVEPVIRTTNFTTLLNPSKDYSKVLKELVNDNERNQMIAKDIAFESDTYKGICLVLSDRKAHCENLCAILKYKYKKDATVLTGDTDTQTRKNILNDLSNGKIEILIATGQLVGEGFDCKELSTLFLTTPVKFSGRLLQYLGRVLRPSQNKENEEDNVKDKARVYDYVDEQVGPLKSSASARQLHYL